jgi:hypothetical protein
MFPFWPLGLGKYNEQTGALAVPVFGVNLFLKWLRMSYIEMGSTRSSAVVKGVSPLGDEIWKCSASALVWPRICSWCLLDWHGFLISSGGGNIVIWWIRLFMS